MGVKVQSSGPSNARVMIIGEAPGRDEEREGVPFIGASGKLLRECLQGIGLDPSLVRFSNLCQERPPNNEIRTFFDDSGRPNPTVMEGLASLHEEIKSVNPDLIIPVGNYPLRILTGKGKWTKEGATGIGNYRGYLLPGTDFAGGRKCLPTYHPAAALRQYPLKHILRTDLAKALRLSSQGVLQYPRKAILVDPSGPDRDAWAQWLVSPAGTMSPLCRATEWNPATSSIVPGNPNDPPFTLPSGAFLTADIEYIGSKLLCCGFTRHADVAIVFSTPSKASVAFIRDILLSGVPLCFQNGMFDCSILEWFYEIEAVKYLRHDTMYMMHAAYIEMQKDLGFIGSMFTDNPPWWQNVDGAFWKEVREGKRPISDVLPYNGYDVCSTHEAAESLLSDELKDPDVLRTYTHEMSLVRPLWQTARRGVRIDTVRLEALKSQLSRESDVYLHGIMRFNDNVPVNVKSPPQVAKFIYDKMALPQIGPKTPTGKWKMDDPTLALLQLRARDERQRVAIKMVREARERLDLISKFCEIELDDDGRMRCHYDPAKTETGRLSSRKFYPTGHGCVPGDAEVLTPAGWRRIDSVGESAVVMQWASSGELTWCSSKRVDYDYSGTMVRADSWFHKGLYTPDHRIPYCDKYLNFKEARTAVSVAPLHYWSLPVSGTFDGQFADNPWVRLAVMTQADGSVEGNGIRLTFQKQRKIDRFMQLCTTAGISWTENQSSHGRRFHISAKDAANILPLISEGGYKTFGPSLLWLTKAALESFIDEVGYWDGHKRGSSYMYYTVNKTNADWVATVAHLTGRSASISVDKDNNAGYGSGNNQWLYTVNVKPRTHVRCEPKHFALEAFTGKVYCMTTQSSFFLMRYQGQIVVTGNSNLQNIPRDGRVRAVFVPDPGYIFGYADLKSAESLVVAHITGDREMLRLHSPEYMSGELDGHKYVASFLLDKPIERITKDERYLGKRVRHAGNYGLSWAKLQSMINADAQETGVSVDAAQAKSLIHRYRAFHPGLQTWWNETQAELWRTHTLFTLHRRKRVFYDRPDAILPEAIAYVPQGTVADTLNLGLLEIAKSEALRTLGFELLLQVHDAVGFQIPEASAGQALALLPGLMDIPLTISRRGVEPYQISIPVEIQVGYNWGEQDSKNPTLNPNGLKSWKAPSA